MKKKSATKQILDILNIQGGKKPKELIKLIGGQPSKVYAGLAYLRKTKRIALDDDGVYITQEPSKVADDKRVIELQKENDQLNKWCLEWRSKCDALEEKTNGLRNLVADQSAIIRYIESKLFKSVKEGSNVKNNINS
jgi:hypothetical protein